MNSTARSHPILITGSHRSGTTWVGRILASAPSTAYIHEPFFPRRGPTTDSAPFERWFTYVCAGNEAPYREAIEELLARARAANAADEPPPRPVIKDPIAVFSARWMAERFHTQNVVLVRHPAAFVASVKAKGWTHPFADFLRQPLLMADHLQPFAREIMRFTRQPHGLVDQAALLWRIIYTVVAQYRRDFPDWTYVRHEDLLRDPTAGFQSLFEHLGLEYGDATERAIAEGQHTVIADWHVRLAGAEIARVKSGVGQIAGCYYGEEDW